MKKKKNIILEIIILITIIASIFTIYYAYNELKNTSPNTSDSKYIENYSKNRYIKIKKDIESLSIYEIPEMEKIITEACKYDYFITATDNYINTIDERITVVFNQELEEPINNDELINFCNSYDEINSNYKLTCSYRNYTLTINNTFYLKNIFNDEIKTKKYTISKDIKYEDKLDEYLENLEKKEIEFQDVPSIE